jgi:hypothetical protein
MSDTLERRLRESMERGAGGMAVEPRAPERVLRRARRRQTGTVLVATAVAVVVAIGSFAAAKLYWPSSRSPAGGLTSSTVGGVTISYPADWQFESGRGADVPLTGADQLPIFALSSEPTAAPILSGAGIDKCSPTGVIFGVLESYGVSPPGPGPAPTDWPAELQRDPSQEHDGCGQFWWATWTVQDRSFGGYLRVGKEATAADRAAGFQAFASMEFGPDPNPPSIPPTAVSVSGGAWVSKSGPGGGLEGTTLATGTANGEKWRLVAGQDHGDIALEVQYPGGAAGIGGFSLPGGPAMEFTSTDTSSSTKAAPDGEVVVFGVAATEVVRIETSETGARAQIIPLPDGLNATFNAFVLVTNTKQGDDLVAYDAQDNELDRQSVGPVAPIAPPNSQGCTITPAESNQAGSATCGAAAASTPAG